MPTPVRQIVAPAVPGTPFHSDACRAQVAAHPLHPAPDPPRHRLVQPPRRPAPRVPHNVGPRNQPPRAALVTLPLLLPPLLGPDLFFFNDTPTTEIYPPSLPDALPIYRKSTRLNSSHTVISSVVFCL